ncbi:MAG: permease [Armatimonadota bacterium]
MAWIQRIVPLAIALIILQLVVNPTPQDPMAYTPDTKWLSDFTTILASILLEAMPFMLIGSIVSGLIEVFVPRELITRKLPQNRFLAVALAGLLGIIFPICECGIVPVVRRLIKKGLPLSCAVTYILAGPIVQPIVFASTVIAFAGSWYMAGMRILGGYIVAVCVGLLTLQFLDKKTKDHITFDMDSEANDKTCNYIAYEDDNYNHDHSHQTKNKLASVLLSARDDFFLAGAFLIFGSFIAASMQTFANKEILANIGQHPIGGILTLMGLAFLLSLCSEADAFVAASFVQFSIPAKLAFLIFGPMVDVKLLAMYSSFLKKRATIFIFGFATILSFVFAFLLLKMGV